MTAFVDNVQATVADAQRTLLLMKAYGVLTAVLLVYVAIKVSRD